ncbi:MAG: ABC transporter permease [Thermoplasmataceae archaeon]
MSGRSGVFLTLIGHYFKNYYRSKSFFLILAVVLLVGSLLTFFSFRYLGDIPRIFPSLSGKMSPALEENLLSYLWALVLIDLPVFSAVFFGSPAISGEIESRTAFYIFTLPIRRLSLLLAKYIAASLATLAAVMIYVLFQFVSLEIIFHGSVPGAFLVSLALLMVFVFSITAFTFLISSIFNKNTYAYISVFLIYFLVFYAATIISEFLYSYYPYFLLNNATSIVGRVYLNINPGVLTTSLSLSGANAGDILSSLLVMILYLVLSLAASAILFERKEVK